MVKVRDDRPRNQDGSLDVSRWISQLGCHAQIKRPERLEAAFSLIEANQDRHPRVFEKGAEDYIETGLEIVDILSGLRLDEDTLLSGLLYRLIRKGVISLDEVEAYFGIDIREQLKGVLKMAAITSYHRQLTSDHEVSEEQLTSVRRMLVALVNDVRVALIKIAERISILRIAHRFDEGRQQRVAAEVFYIYAPLAHRLGIGQLKWELEDLSFRYLNSTAYHEIASQLDEKRLDRQQYIAKMRITLEQALSEAGVEAVVAGRAKHIYSIWRKMERKQIRFDQVMDIRAVRIMVPTVRDCYAALGIVHGLYRSIPREFDDYIANPKPNGYRSLHTAVISLNEKVVEIQIRTHDMHEAAELGVCSHWKYKGTDGDDKSGYEEKISWLRQVLDWHEKLGTNSDLIHSLNAEVENERVYVFTPKGDVIDLPEGSTPVDFAYHLHTDVGHHCRGARINRKLVSLDTPLKTGDQIQIMTDSKASPNRDWLNSDNGYIRTLRARQKVAQWFRQQSREQQVSDGRQVLEKELKRLGIRYSEDAKLLSKLRLDSFEELYARLGSGRLRLPRVLLAFEQLLNHDGREDSESLPSRIPKTDRMPSRSRPTSDTGLMVEGLTNFMAHLANCCQPIPNDSVVGYLTKSSGVSVHRKDCANLQHLLSEHPEMELEVSWGDAVDEVMVPVEITLEAEDRRNLLLDVTQVVSKAGLNILGVDTRSIRNTGRAVMKLTLEVSHLQQLSSVMTKIENLSGIHYVKRSH